MNQDKKWMALKYSTYKEAKKNFYWNERWAVFDGAKETFNIAHECVDRHHENEIALRIKFANGNSEIYTFGELSRFTSKFANFLDKVGIGFGDRVAVLLFPSIEFYGSVLGVYKRGAILVPCFPLFGPEAIAYRLEDAKVNAIVLARDNKDLINPGLIEKLNLKLIYSEDLRKMLQGESDTYKPKTSASDLCMIQYSSGTTGVPKAIMYNHGAITVAAVVTKFGIGLKPKDTYFCPSSPAWGHGIWYGTISPLIYGKAIGTFSGKFDPKLCLEALEEFKITNMSAISSHYRLMMETEKTIKYKLKLERISYTGEPMSKEVIEQIKNHWDLVPFCQYGTTEVGPITLDYCGFEDWLVKPGSLGKPMIGGLYVAVIDENGDELPPEQTGQIALRRDNHWVRVGDNAYKDKDGYFWYVGRKDDIIISAGYTIGPVEVEQMILNHPAVEECAVVGSPDKERGEIVKAFVKLKLEYSPSESLAKEIQEFVRSRLSKHEYPRKLEFIKELPKTPDGKIRRKLLKEMEIQKIKNFGFPQ